jgi:hypothetical protein
MHLLPDIDITESISRKKIGPHKLFHQGYEFTLFCHILMYGLIRRLILFINWNVLVSNSCLNVSSQSSFLKFYSDRDILYFVR